MVHFHYSFEILTNVLNLITQLTIGSLKLSKKNNSDHQIKQFHWSIIRLSVHSWKAAGSIWRGEVGGGIFCIFFLFSMRSHHVPMWFLKGSHNSQSFSPRHFNSMSILLHMVCPKLNSHVYKLKRWAIREHVCLYFATWGPTRCFYWGVPNRTFMMGQS